MTKNVATLSALVALSLFLGSTNVNAAGWSFSSQGLDDVVGASSSEVSLSGVTDLKKNELAAMTLAITWPEVAGNAQYTPSPMTLSRWDGSYSRLWSFSKKDSSSSTNPYVRAHFNPGVGVWQLDSAGIGKGIGVHQAINTSTAAPIVIKEIIRRWKNATGTKSQRRTAAWGAWYGCSNGKCETIFNQIYNTTSDTLSVTRDVSVYRTGGMETKTCKYNYSGSNPPFTCYKVDITKAQGHTSSWIYTLNGTASQGLSPVPLAFYTYTYGSNEYRHWLSGFSQTVYAIRPLVSDARSSLDWFTNSIVTEY